MLHHLGVEDIEPNNWVAWVFEIPGCYSRAASREEAIRLAPTAIADWVQRLKGTAQPLPDGGAPIRTVVAEEFHALLFSPDYLVNAFFENDALPLTRDNIALGETMLRLQRHDLDSIRAALPQDVVEREIAGEAQGNILGILRHIGTAEWWYWDRLGMACPRSQRPTEITELLSTIRQFTLENLPKLIGSELTTVYSGERWSPRKLLRRALWHEHVHTRQIARCAKTR